MKKNILGAITIIALVIGAFGLTFGYLTMTQPEAINPIIFLSQLPRPEGGNNGQVPQIETYHSDYFVIQDIPAGGNKSTSSISLQKRVRIDSVWGRTNTSGISSGQGKIRLNITIDGTTYIDYEISPMITSDPNRWSQSFYTGNYILPNGTNAEMSLIVVSSFDIPADIEILFQYTVF